MLNPLIEAIFEVRFLPKLNFATELLIAINQVFSDHLSIIHADGLQIPNDLKLQQNDFYYTPSYKINYSSFSLLVADGSIVILKNALDGQYEGWNIFKELPLQILNILKSKNPLDQIQRYSLKYTNLIRNDLSLNDLNFTLKIGETALQDDAKLALKTELHEDNFIIMTDIASHVELRNISDVTGKITDLNGTLLIIDVINNSGIQNPNDAEHEFIRVLDIIHDKVDSIYRTIYNKRGC
ncbi:hypothetical protein ACIAD2134 [Acinetobacter baylyi ADP1]|uniref:TIGR04255 family protein n=1 Tax=Acinetobacter baylyi (strain ATCC 33305 / BD413 / ADP1) TaxID=62977 RepID=Q6FAH4_ACIAD|nr:hypothetical protein ACIAD2134 [Acinetobacter baylyi ADP1]